MKFYSKKKMSTTATAKATSSSDRQLLLLPSVGSPSLSTTPTNNSSSASCSPIPVALLQPPPCTPCGGTGGGDEHEVGRYYEIDHTHLPPKSPTQLKIVRVVKVSAKTKLDLTVSFSSTQSLREYFKVESSDLTTGVTPMVGHKKRKLGRVILHPELDEQFVMSTNHALRILSRPVPKAELDSSQGHEKFWVLNTKTCEQGKAAKEEENVDEEGENEEEEEVEVGRDIKSVDVLRWGVKRRASYCGRQKGNVEKNRGNLSSVLVTMIDEGGKARKNKVGVGKKRGRKCKINKNIVEYRKKPKKDKRTKEISELGVALVPSGQISTAIDYHKNSKDRWSTERYETAELKLLGIMKEKNAVLGNRILRPELREEARKHIGDTGLLDHLLKHMAGKVVSDGKERFRRRHNSEGAMEYWLEDVELEEMRKSAGVADSGWVPPPGWKIGDGVYTCGGGFSMELVKLKEEIICLRREMEEVHCLKQMQQEKNARDAQTDTDAAGSKNLQENLESLLKWKTKVEDEIISMISSLHTVKEDVMLMREELKHMRESKEQEECHQKSDKKEDDNNMEKSSFDDEKTKERILVINCKPNKTITTTTAAANNSNNTKCSNGGSKNATSSTNGRLSRKSGFRICKPQGTFLWPNMMSANAGTNNSNISGTTTTTKTANVGYDGGSSSNICMASPRSLVVPYEDIFGVPTPPSASSVTSPPVLPLQLGNNNFGNGNTTTTSSVGCEMMLVRRHHHHCHQDKRNSTAGGSSSDSTATLFQQRSSHGVFLPRSSMMMEGVDEWSSISTDLALASPSYNH